MSSCKPSLTELCTVTDTVEEVSGIELISKRAMWSGTTCWIPSRQTLLTKCPMISTCWNMNKAIKWGHLSWFGEQCATGSRLMMTYSFLPAATLVRYPTYQMDTWSIRRTYGSLLGSPVCSQETITHTLLPMSTKIGVHNMTCFVIIIKYIKCKH